MSVTEIHPSIPRLLAFATRVFVWGLIFLSLYLLRSFFLLLFFTFVFAYIQVSLGAQLESRIRNRVIRTVVVGLGILAVLISLGLYLTPNVRSQAEVFVSKFPTYVQALDNQLKQFANKYPVLYELSPVISETRHSEALNGAAVEPWDLRTSPTAILTQQILEGSGVRYAVDTARNIGGGLLSVVSAFLLSLLFSFLIVLDLPALRRGVHSLVHTRVSFIYNEVADSIYNFGKILGQSLQAQLLVAIGNTVMTALGLYLLGLQDKMAFLSVIVFFCSFIPVAGVFISSVPICLLVLQQSGFGMVMFAVLLIWIIHLCEAYILNPKIYGHQLRLNPVVVLIILTIGGKLFHVWGLILGLPVCTYLFRHAIQYKQGE